MKWNLECKYFPLRDDEREALIQCVHTAATMANHDCHHVRKAGGDEDPVEHRNAVTSAMLSGLGTVQQVLDAIYIFLRETDQLEAFDACRPYIVEGLKLKAMLEGHTQQILTRVAAGTRSDPDLVAKAYNKEQQRLNEMNVICECPLCCVMSIMDFSFAGKKLPQPSEPMKMLHEHIKGKGAIDDLLDRLK